MVALKKVLLSENVLLSIELLIIGSVTSGKFHAFHHSYAGAGKRKTDAEIGLRVGAEGCFTS